MKLGRGKSWLVIVAGLCVAAVGCEKSAPAYDIVPVESTAELYKVKPGSTQWRQFEHHGQMVVATDLPDTTVKAMTTEQLLDACLAYPLLGDMMFYNSPEQGFEAVLRQFGGLRELLTRPDVGAVALAKYRAIDATSVDADPENPKLPGFVMQLAMFEHLIARPEVLDRLTDQGLQSLASEAARKLAQKHEPKRSAVYGGMSFDATSQVATRATLRLQARHGEQRPSRRPAHIEE